jgi:hypothetical protein
MATHEFTVKAQLNKATMIVNCKCGWTHEARDLNNGKDRGFNHVRISRKNEARDS